MVKHSIFLNLTFILFACGERKTTLESSEMAKNRLPWSPFCPVARRGRFWIPRTGQPVEALVPWIWPRKWLPLKTCVAAQKRHCSPGWLVTCYDLACKKGEKPTWAGPGIFFGGIFWVVRYLEGFCRSHGNEMELICWDDSFIICFTCLQQIQGQNPSAGCCVIAWAVEQTAVYQDGTGLSPQEWTRMVVGCQELETWTLLARVSLLP